MTRRSLLAAPMMVALKRRWLRVAKLAALGIAPVIPAAAQQFPEVPLYELLPPDYPYPLARVCSTQAGICDIPTYVFAGTPCACRRSDGFWVSGVCTH